VTNVLVFDDHPIVLQGCRRLFEDVGICEVMEASSALAGYRLLLRRHPNEI